MNQQENAVWAAVYAAILIEENRCVELPRATEIAISEADNAIIALRRKVLKSGRLHANECLELDRRAELDIPEGAEP